MSQQNMPSSQALPGFWGFVNYNPGGGGAGRRCLLWGYMGAAGQATPNLPRLITTQDDADDAFVRGSDAANAYAAASSQPESQGAEIWVVGLLEPAGGAQSTYKLKVYVSNTNPSKSGTMQGWIDGQQLPAVGFSASDTSSTIAAALVTAIQQMKDLPIASVAAVADVVTITYIHKGTTGEDFPMRWNITLGAGVNLSPAQEKFATNAAGAGSVKTTYGASSVSTVIGNADTPSAIATKVAASWNADSYALKAVVDGGDATQVNLLFVNDKDVHRISATVLTSTGTTVNVSGTGATDGSGSASSLSYNGVQGTGLPSLAGALTNLANLPQFRSWAAPWIDATSLGSMGTNIEASDDGSISGQKDQHLTVCDFQSQATDGAIPPSVTPDLTATAPHYALGRAADCAVPAFWLACRIAAARAAFWIDEPRKNWNGFQLKGNQRSQLLVPATNPSQTVQNTDLVTYGVFPIVKGPSGFYEVVKGRTTSLASDKRLWAWSTEAQAAYHKNDLRTFLRSRFGDDASIARYSEAKSANIFDTASVKSAIQERMRFWEAQGNYDGADALKDLVVVTINSQNPFRFDAKYPESPVLDLDQIVFSGQFTQPST